MTFNLSRGIPNPDINSVQIGRVEIRFYALFVLTGIALTMWITARRLKQNQAPPVAVLGVVLWAVPFGMTKQKQRQKADRRPGGCHDPV